MQSVCTSHIMRLGNITVQNLRKGTQHLVALKKIGFTTSAGGIHLKSGAVMPKPPKRKLGLLKVCTLVVPFVLFGGYLSSLGAELLHEYDIFSPDDD